MSDHPHPFQNKSLRAFFIVLIALIAISTSVSAFFAFRAGHMAKAASVFFAGLTFVILFGTNLRIKR